MGDSLHLSADVAREYAERVLARAGFGTEDAVTCADLLVGSSLRGVDSHGVVALLPMFVEHARAGVGREGTSPTVVAEHGAAVVVRGGGASGPRTARFAAKAASERARQLGVGVAVAAEIGYFGALWWCVAPAAEAGLIAVAACNAMAFVAPPAASKRSTARTRSPSRSRAIRTRSSWTCGRTRSGWPTSGAAPPPGTPCRRER